MATAVSYVATIAALAGAAMVQASQASRAVDGKPDEKRRRANLLGVAVCVIALVHYLFMTLGGSSDGLSLRYSDWFLTVPLLVLELGAVASSSSRPAVNVLLAVAMLALGAASLGFPAGGGVFWALTAASFLCLALLARNLFWRGKKQQDTPSRRWAMFFFALWPLYGFLHLLPQGATLQQTGYNYLDLLTKAGFGLTVALL